MARAKRPRELNDLVVCFMLFIWVKAGLMAREAKALGMPKENTKKQQNRQIKCKPMTTNSIRFYLVAKKQGFI